MRLKIYFITPVWLINGRKGAQKHGKCLIGLWETSEQGRTSTSSDKGKVFQPCKVRGRGSTGKEGATWAKCSAFFWFATSSKALRSCQASKKLQGENLRESRDPEAAADQKGFAGGQGKSRRPGSPEQEPRRRGPHVSRDPNGLCQRGTTSPLPTTTTLGSMAVTRAEEE